MAKLPSFAELGLDAPHPQANVVQLRGSTGAETLPGEALAREGTQLQGEGDKLWAAAKAEQERLDTTRVEDAWNQYRKAALDVTSGQQGLLNTRGADAVNGDLWKRAGDAMTPQRKAIMEGLNETQAERFRQRADATDLQVQHQIVTHVATEQRAYQTTVLNGTYASSQAAIAARPDDPAVFIGERDRAFRQLDTYLAANGITHPSAIEKERSKVNDGLIHTRIDSLLSVNQPLLAEQLWKGQDGKPGLSSEVSSPEIRITLNNKIHTAALVSNLAVQSTSVFDETLAEDAARRAREGDPVPRETGAVKTSVGTVPGMVSQGNIDLNARPVVKNKDGSISTVRSISANFDGKEVLIPTVSEDGKILTDEQAIAQYRRTGKNLGVFDTPEAATAYAERLHQQQAQQYGDPMAAAQAATTAARADTSGRREKLVALLTDKAAPPTAPQRKAIEAELEKLDRQDAAAGRDPGLQKVSTGQQAAADNSTVYRDTTGVPNSRNVAALLPQMLEKLEQRADTIYGKDRTNPDRIEFVKRGDAELRSKVNTQVQALQAIQKEALDTVANAILGATPSGTAPAGGGMMNASTGAPGGMQRITSFGQLQQNPQLMQAFWRLDADGKRTVDTMIRTAANIDEKGDPALFNEMRNRINLPPDDPKKINWIQTLNQDPRVQAGNLNMAQMNFLRSEIDRSATDDGRSQAASIKVGESLARSAFRNNKMLTMAGTDFSKSDSAQYLWWQDAMKTVGQYKAANKDIRPLFDQLSPESLVSPTALEKYAVQAGALGSTAEALAAAAANVKAGAAPTRPSTIKTAEELKKWVDALPSGVTQYTTPDGKVKNIPSRMKLAAPPATPAALPLPRYNPRKSAGDG